MIHVGCHGNNQINSRSCILSRPFLVQISAQQSKFNSADLKTYRQLGKAGQNTGSGLVRGCQLRSLSSNIFHLSFLFYSYTSIFHPKPLAFTFSLNFANLGHSPNLLWGDVGDCKCAYTQ